MEMPGLKVNARVKDALKYMASRHVMLVPLFSAGGMRVKIIEGMALGKAIISTPVGAEGVDHTDGKNILLANTATCFVDHIVALIDHPERIPEIGSSARELVHRRYAHRQVIKDLLQLFQRLVKA